MEDALHKIRNWASHGTLRQFRTEIAGKVAPDGYEVEMEGDTLVCYRVSKAGGFLGIGARKVKETVLEVVGEGEGMQMIEESADEEFVAYLAGKLTQH